MGGTFNPIHYGHLATAENIREQFGMDEVVFVPSYMPPHKSRDIADSQHRFMMTLIATCSNSSISVSDIEIRRKGKSYTSDTIKQFRKQYGRNTEIYFITGADAFAQIHTWKDCDKLLSICKFIAARRPGYNLDGLEAKYKKNLKIVEVPALAISSTDIRERIRKRKSVKYLLPEEVERYIYANGLYV